MRAILLAVLLAGCGARTGVDVPDPVDAGPPDARPGFGTLPCRWTYAQPLELARTTTAFRHIEVAVHGSRDEVVVLAQQAMGPTVGALLRLGDPPTSIAPLGFDPTDPDGGKLFGHSAGYGFVGRPGCTVRFYDDAFEPAEEIVVGEGRCTLEPSSADRLDLTLTEGTRYALYSRDLPGGAPERWGPFGMDVRSLTPARSVRTEPLGWLALASEGDTVTVRRFDPSGRPLDARPTALPNILDMALDRERSAAVVLGNDTAHRVPFDTLEPEPFLDFPALGFRPTLPTGIVTNESEALFALADGRILAAPLNGTFLRFLEPPAERVQQMRIALRAGGSAGGVAYTHRPTPGATVLSFRPLTCNR